MRVHLKALFLLSLSLTKPLFLHFCIIKFPTFLSFHGFPSPFPEFALITAHECGEVLKELPRMVSAVIRPAYRRLITIIERYTCSLSKPVPAPVTFPQRFLRQGTQTAHSHTGYPSGQAMKLSRFDERENIRMCLRTLPSH